MPQVEHLQGEVVHGHALVPRRAVEPNGLEEHRQPIHQGPDAIAALLGAGVGGGGAVASLNDGVLAGLRAELVEHHRTPGPLLAGDPVEPLPPDRHLALGNEEARDHDVEGAPDVDDGLRKELDGGNVGRHREGRRRGDHVDHKGRQSVEKEGIRSQLQPDGKVRDDGESQCAQQAEGDLLHDLLHHVRAPPVVPVLTLPQYQRKLALEVLERGDGEESGEGDCREEHPGVHEVAKKAFREHGEEARVDGPHQDGNAELAGDEPPHAPLHRHPVTQ
mmetsp:Transcript_13970/g.36037  ORF Transcript_13970/g.36037 Transcript_13970/m.36037 type:complete len:276 (-) Transcript_13970:261-1088(-)